jgi:hypothetical protein
LLIGAGASDTATDNVRAKRFELVDAQGKVRVIIGDLSATGGNPDLGIGLANEEEKILARLGASGKFAGLSIASVEGAPLTSLSSVADASQGQMSGDLSIHNRGQDSTMQFGMSGGTTGIMMVQTVQPGEGSVVARLLFSKDRSSSLVLGDGIDLEQVILSAPADKPCMLKLGDKAAIFGGTN